MVFLLIFTLHRILHLHFYIQMKIKRPVLHQCLMLWLLQQINVWAFCLWESNREIPRMKSWPWNRDGLFKKDGSQMCTRWQLSKRPQHNCLHMIVLCIDPTTLLVHMRVFFFQFKSKTEFGSGFYDFMNKNRPHLWFICDISQWCRRQYYETT